MSLSSLVNDLAARIASEFNSVRSEITASSGTVWPSGTTFPSNPGLGQPFVMSDDSSAYVYTNDGWIVLTPFGAVIDGGDPAGSSMTMDVLDGGTP